VCRHTAADCDSALESPGVDGLTANSALPVAQAELGAGGPAPEVLQNDDVAKFRWTPAKICLSLALFVLAGLAEIGGGWLVWQTIRCPPCCAALHAAAAAPDMYASPCCVLSRTFFDVLFVTRT